MKRLLVANRGEIAVRIIRTAHDLGIETVAVYSAADEDAAHVRMADRAVAVGPSPATKSYLVTNSIVAAARETGADAIHPGYGFLSEQSTCADAGLTFVGPDAGVIDQMGDKVQASSRWMAYRPPSICSPKCSANRGSAQQISTLKLSSDGSGNARKRRNDRSGACGPV